jgi:arylsulfatase A-like enzyme
MRRAIVVVALLALGCVERERELLAPELAVAKKSWDGILLELGSPRALPHLSEDGWSHGESAPDGNTFRWAVAKTASFTFMSARQGDRLAWIECEPFVYHGSPAQWIALSVNGRDVTEIELRPGRERYPVELPIVAGENTVGLRFRYAGDPNRRSADRRELAAAFYRFDIPPDGVAPVAGATGPFARVDGGIHLPAGGGVLLYARVDDGARVRVETTRPGLTVDVRSRERELASQTVDTAWERELDASGVIEIRLHASESTVARPELYVPARAPAERELHAVDANIVLVFLDGANALRMGSETTPVLEALAGESLVFEHAVSQAVYTIASIGSVLTGQYPERHQSVSFADKLGDDVVTFPGLLAEGGYRTAGFSGNAVASETFGLDRGYQEFFQIWERDDYTGHGDSVLRGFRDWLAGVGGERFFAYVHFREPHFPYNPPAPFGGESALFPGGMADWSVVEAMNVSAAAGEPPSDEVLERVRTLYEGNFAYVDDLIGQLVRCLEERGLDDDTVLIVTADHGEALFEHGYIGHNTQLYEESVRVPLMVKLPGEPPRRVSDLVELIDLAPTILELAGIAPPASMQGRSLFAPHPERIAFSRTVWKRARYSARTDRYKLIWDSRTGATELYDLEADPGETETIDARSPFVAGHLEHELFAWLRAQEALRADADAATISDEERRRLESLGYTRVLEEKR